MGRPWKRSVQENSPELASQAFDWDPARVGEGSNVILNWFCSICGLVWPASPAARKRQPKCPGCTDKVLVVGFNDVATRLPHLIPEVEGWDPASFRHNEATTVDWRCPVSTCGVVYDMPINRRRDGRGCPYCSGKRIAVGVNDLNTTHPDIAADAHDWDPTQHTAGSSKVVPWKCSKSGCGYEWPTAICNRTLQATRCPACANKVVVPGYNDLATTHPELAQEAFRWDPSKFTFGSDAMVRWQCSDKSCWRQWEDTISHRTSGGRGCPDCRLLKKNGGNRLTDKHPNIAAEAFTWDPRFVSAAARQVLPWRCVRCDHIWRAKVSARAFGSGCPECSTRGFDSSQPGFVYLLEKRIAGRTALKIGITNNIEQRNAYHRRHGWKVCGVSEVLAGTRAKQHETAVLTMLDALGVDRGFAAFGVAFPGYTESWWLDSYPASTLPDLLTKAHATTTSETRLLRQRARITAPRQRPAA